MIRFSASRAVLGWTAAAVAAAAVLGMTRGRWERPLLARLPESAVRWLAERLPSEGVIQLEAGIRARESGRLEAAEAAFLAASLGAPDGEQAGYLLALTRIERGDAEGAMRAYREAAARAPEAPEARVIDARQRFDAGDVEGSIRDLETLVRKHPGLPDAWQALALCYSELYDTRRAREALEQALRLAPRRCDLLRDAARVHLQVGALPEAERYARQALQRAPREPFASLYLGQVLLDRGPDSARLAESRRLLSAAAEDARTRAAAVREAGRAARLAGDLREASSLLETACRLAPRDPTASYQYAQVLGSLDDPRYELELARFRRLEWETREEKSLRGAVREQLTAYAPRERLVRFYLETHRFLKAVRVLQDYLRRVPGDSRGRALERAVRSRL